MNAKIFELYKEHKVNPIGGCLPIFAQIPVFFALFNVLRSAIELRHAEFLGFISDLSQPDMLFVFPANWALIGGMPFNILPFLMGGAMYLQQRLMPTSAEPMQQKMMGFMTIFITFVCYSMPAGLTLYWTVSNVCSIIQYRITHKMIEKQSASSEA
jgi:YidC/Oxa1 family membrane protein insertase